MDMLPKLTAALEAVMNPETPHERRLEAHQVRVKGLFNNKTLNYRPQIPCLAQFNIVARCGFTQRRTELHRIAPWWTDSHRAAYIRIWSINCYQCSS